MASSSTDRQNQTRSEKGFHEIAPKSTEPWDIFINHRGCNVKHTLATTICHTLQSVGLRVFLNVEALDAGDCIPAEIQHAIDTATLHIVIFSPNFAESPCCLAELSFMLKTGTKVIPIFYHVDPSDLRWVEKGKGTYAPAFSEHEKKGRYKSEMLDEWKGALHNSSFLSSYLVNNNEDEATVLKNIVNCAFKITKKGPLWAFDRPLQLDELVQDFESVAREETVKIRGIVGVGGSGKTTLAKELYNRNASSFERCSLVLDVRDAASRNALLDKQKQLLFELGVRHLLFENIDEGKVLLANHLSSYPVLIVLDGVDHIDHLNALLPNKDILRPQSMIIVTTRELGVLVSCGLSSSSVYRMPGLNTSLAEQLFCWYAFLQTSPPTGFETLVREFVKACNGLPLSLKVLGAQLYGRKSKEYWKSQLNKVLRILPGEIKERLQISYYALDEEEREMFLDVACFLIGNRKSRAIAVWDGSGWSGLHGLETLVNKCLVELVGDEGEETIRMHDHLRDMGRDIASSHSPYRFWRPEVIYDIMKHCTERKLIRGIQPADAFVVFKKYSHQLMGNSIRLSKRLRFSNGLQILSVEGYEFTEEFASFSEDLVWLRWERFPLRNVPSWLILKNLRVLELSEAYELEELWQANAYPPLQLRELILKDCRNLHWHPSSLKHLQDLKRLDVDFVGSTLPEEFCDLHSLEHLPLHSSVLSSLPAGFGNLTSLRKINLQYCNHLSMLPDSFSQLIHLEGLYLSSCKMLSSLPAGFGSLKRPRKINLQNCNQLSMLPDSFSQLIHLEDLHLSSCEMLSSLPAGFGNLKSLRKIILLGCNQLSMLPDSFSQLIHLEELYLSSCEMLFSLPAGFGNLKSLRMMFLWNCNQLSMLPDSFSQLIHLEDLYLSNCEVLSSLPGGFGNLKSLRNIKLENCNQLSMLPDSFSQLIHLEDLYLSSCEMLSSLPAGFGILKSLRKIDLWNCNQLSMLPDSFSQLIHLEDLYLSSCKMLSSLPAGFGSLKSLRKINLQNCNQLSMLPDSFSQLIDLEDLHLSSCEMLSSLPAGFGNLKNLRNIILLGCNQLSMLPDSFSQLIHLDDLYLSSCEMLSSLPTGFGNLKSLRRIYLENCNQLSMLPDSFSQLIHLAHLHLSSCEMLSSLPEMLPVSLKILRIYSCNLLKNIRCISGHTNLVKLKICDCLQIEGLPSFADLALLNKFKMRNCPKVAKLEEPVKSSKIQSLSYYFYD